MNFIKYNEIENHYRKSYIDHILTPEITGDDIQWVALEKVHGTNLQIDVSDLGVKFGKRSGFIESGENFFEIDVIKSMYEEKALNMFNTLKKMCDITRLTIYGEYAGTMTSGKKVQKQIEYGNQDFYVFDIMIDGKLINFDLVVCHCQASGFTTAPVLKVGTFTEVMDLENDFQSVVREFKEYFNSTKPSFCHDIEYTKKHNLVKGTDNVAEGFVARPITPIYTKRGRVIIKSKNSLFTEKKVSKKKVDVDNRLSDTDKEVVRQVSEYVCESRLRNVLSKIGVPTQNQFGKVSGMFAQDSIKDWEKDNERLIKDVDDPNKVCREINHLCSTLLRERWLEILDNIF